MLLVRNIRLPLSCTERQAVQEALRILHLPAAAVRESGIAKISVDARHRKPVLVYTVAITLNDEGAEPAYAGAAPCCWPGRGCGLWCWNAARRWKSG